MVGFKKATKEQSFLRLGLYGPSGGGKTMTSLRTAAGMLRIVKGRIAFICSERGAASKYADRFDFDVLDLEERTVEDYIEAIDAAAKAKYSVLIIDSSTHAWSELIADVEQIAKARFKGNFWSAWSEGTPKQKAFIDKILQYPGHVIVTMRAKTEWDTDKDSKKPVRVGLAPEQGKGIEYEYDMLMSINTDHIGLIEKDRTGKYQDKIITKPDEDFGEELARWLSDGAPRVEKPAPITADQKTLVEQLCREFGLEGSIGQFVRSLNGGEKLETADEGAKVIAELRKRIHAKRGTEHPTSSTGGGTPAVESSAKSVSPSTTNGASTTAAPSPSTTPSTGEPADPRGNDDDGYDASVAAE